jgi:hypothetical protein
MQKQAILETLPLEDQTFILNLCRTHTYSDAVEKLRLPREQGGLDLVTNRASLCRFVQKKTEKTTAVAEAILERLKSVHPADTLDHSDALIRLIQERIFSSLASAREFNEVRREFEAYIALKRQNFLERKKTPPKPDPDVAKKHNAILAKILGTKGAL